VTASERWPFYVWGFRGAGTSEGCSSLEEAAERAVERTTTLQHLHVIVDAEGNLVRPPEIPM
jgi:hypothetical protein